MAQRIVDEFEPVDVDQQHGYALATARAQLAQRAIELIHEVATIRQAGEGIVIARVFEALLQLLALLHFGRQLAVCDLQLPARVRDSIAGAMQAVYEVVRREREQPGH